MNQPPDPLQLLVPRPKSVQTHPGGLHPDRRSALRIAREEGVGLRASDALARALATPVTHSTTPAEAEIVLVREDGVPAQGYRLGIRDGRATLTASDDAGHFYAACTLAQIARIAAARGEPWPGVEIEDAPDIATRGVLLDVSRDRVPTLDALLELIERLARLKINQLQLHIEHTFAFAGHEQVWRDASPFTPEEIETIDRFCSERFIELVPHLQSFGHMHRWLVHDRYRGLSECPEGVLHPFALEREPFSLCAVDPESFRFLAELYDLYLPRFRSRQFHVGCDETFDLGQGRSREACRERGKGRVYVDYLNRVHELVHERGHRMHLWGDIILEHPDLIGDLPDDCVTVAWGYEASHPFDAQARQFAQTGRPFYVCPGTSSWQSLVGRVTNARENLAVAARAAVEHGAEGYLIADWGDFGHWQPPSISWPGFLVGAGRAWNAGAEIEPLTPMLDLFALDDPKGVAGEVLCALGDLYLEGALRPANATVWFYLLRDAFEPFPPPRVAGIDGADLARVEARATEVLAGLAGHGIAGSAGEVLVDELTWAVDVTRFGCRLGRERLAHGTGASVADLPVETRRALASELDGIVERMRSVWTTRSRPGGLADSAARLANVLPEASRP